jgi:hypothetical protein
MIVSCLYSISVASRSSETDGETKLGRMMFMPVKESTSIMTWTENEQITDNVM